MILLLNQFFFLELPILPWSPLDSTAIIYWGSLWLDWKDWCWSIGRTDIEAEAPILWPPDTKSWLTRKDSDAGKGRRQEEKGTTEDKMVGWHHRLNGHEFEEALADGEGQGSLAETDMTEQLNNNGRILF